MNSVAILKAINEIAATSSKNDKQTLVNLYVGDALFCRVLDYAYNPFKTYGVRKMPIGKAHNGFKQFDAETWTMLDNLIARTLTGNAAAMAIEAEIDSLDEDSAELLRRIIRKDLRAGFSESTCNKAKKGLIPDFPYMRCCLPKDAKLNTFDWTLGVVSQEKADGMFANINCELGDLVTITSRQGTPLPIEAFPELAAELAERIPPGVQLHGELLVMRDGKVLAREIGNGILNSVANGGGFDAGDHPIYMVWDMIPLTAVVTKGKHDEPYIKRLSKIIAALKATPGSCVKLIDTKIVHDLGAAYAHAAQLMRGGKEGTVIKNPHATWKDGTSKEQVKLKLEFEVDLEIEGIVEGRVGTKNEGRAGSFACRTCDGKLKVDVTVKNEALRDSVDANPDEFIGRIIAVTANDIMAPSESSEFYSLFLPRMSEGDYRTDKTTADSLERVIAQKEAAIYGEQVMKKAA